MNLTCNFRDLADKVRKSFTTSGRHRSASSHECQCTREDGGSHLDRSTSVRGTSYHHSHTSSYSSTPLKHYQKDAWIDMSKSLIYVVDEASDTPSTHRRRRHETHADAPVHNLTCVGRTEQFGARHSRREAFNDTSGFQQPTPAAAPLQESYQAAVCEHSEVSSPYSVRTSLANKPRKSASLQETARLNESIDLNFDATLSQGCSVPKYENHQETQRIIRSGASQRTNISSRQLAHESGANSTSSIQITQQLPDISVHDEELRSGSLGTVYPCYYNVRTRPYFAPSSPIKQSGIADPLIDAQRLTMSHSGLAELQCTSHMTFGNHLKHSHQRIVHSSQQLHLNQYGTSDGGGNFRHKSIRSAGVTKLSKEQQDSTIDQPQPVAHRLSSKPEGMQVSSTTNTVVVEAQVAMAHDEHQEVAPVLPTRSSSLLSQAWDNGKHRSNYAYKTNENKGSRKASKHTFIVQNNISLKEHNSHGSCAINRPTHVRSRSDMIQHDRRCYVNVSQTSTNVCTSETSVQGTSNNKPQCSVSGEHSSSSSQFATTSSSNSATTGYPTAEANCVIQAVSSLPGKSHEPATKIPTSEGQSNNGVNNFPNSSSCILLEQCIPSTHASRLLGRMSDKLRDGRLADVILLAGAKSTNRTTRSEPLLPVFDDNDLSGEKMSTLHSTDPVARIPAHRVILAAASDYFAAMFGNELKEATEMEIWIHDVEPHALQTLVNYIYTGHLNLSEANVEDVLEAACFLQMPEASQACERFLIKRLHGSNCLAMARLGEHHGCPLLHRKAIKYALEHFMDVVQQPDFLNLSLTGLLELIASDHLSTPNEAAVFAACLRWARHQKARQPESGEPSRSLTHLSDVLKFVRLHQLPARLLIDVLEKEPLFHDDMEAIQLIASALRSHLAPEPRTSLMSSSLQVSNEMNSSSVLLGLQEPSRMLTMKTSRSKEQFPDQTSAVDSKTTSVVLSCVKRGPRPSTIGRLWALGGKTMTTTRALQEILEYDPYWDSWKVVGQLPGQRQQCGCIVLRDGRLLVVGGRDELKTLSTVECVHTEELSIQTDQKTSFGNPEDWSSSEATALLGHTSGPLWDQDVQLLTGSYMDNNEQRSSSTDVRGQHDAGSGGFGGGDRQSGWHVVSAMATHRHGLGVAVLEGVVYAVGGHDGWSYLNTVERWNGRAKSWSPVTPMAVQRSTVGVAALDGLLYAVGGRDGSACLRTVERFNPHTQHWCFIAPMLHRRGGVGVGATGGRLYAVGGHNAPPSQPHALRTASVEMYEPQTDMWTEVACLSSPRDSIAVATLGAKLFALGGHDGQTYTDRVQVYDPETNGWSDAASLPSGRAGVAVASSPPPGGLSGHFSIRVPFYKADPLA